MTRKHYQETIIEAQLDLRKTLLTINTLLTAEQVYVQDIAEQHPEYNSEHIADMSGNIAHLKTALSHLREAKNSLGYIMPREL